MGLVIGFPLDVGVLWQTTERVALRADVGFSFNTFESSNETGLSFGSGARSTITTTSSSGFTTIGLSALFAIRNDDNLRLYVAPRGAIEIVSRSVETEIVPPPGQSSRLPVVEASDSSRGHEVDLMFGGQYRLRDRLALFGETGLAYRRSTFPALSTTLSIVGAVVSSTSSEPDSHTTNVGLKSTVGLVLFF